jgi:hypothetical protein
VEERADPHQFQVDVPDTKRSRYLDGQVRHSFAVSDDPRIAADAFEKAYRLVGCGKSRQSETPPTLAKDPSPRSRSSPLARL